MQTHAALALLMADKQWGSGGTVNYLQEARTIIAEGPPKELARHNLDPRVQSFLLRGNRLTLEGEDEKVGEARLVIDRLVLVFSA